MTKRVYKRRVDPDFEAFNQKLGERVRDLRTELNINQDDFARAANIHRTHIGKLENAQVDPSLSTLFKVAKTLDMTVAQLLSFGEE